jgi:hypothetical protein
MTNRGVPSPLAARVSGTPPLRGYREGYRSTRAHRSIEKNAGYPVPPSKYPPGEVPFPDLRDGTRYPPTVPRPGGGQC